MPHTTEKSPFSGFPQYLPRAKNGLHYIVSNIDSSLDTIKAYTAFHRRQKITANYRNTPVTDRSNQRSSQRERYQCFCQEDKKKA